MVWVFGWVFGWVVVGWAGLDNEEMEPGVLCVVRNHEDGGINAFGTVFVAS